MPFLFAVIVDLPNQNDRNRTESERKAKSIACVSICGFPRTYKLHRGQSCSTNTGSDRLTTGSDRFSSSSYVLLIDWVNMEKLAISEGKDPGECASLVSSPVKHLSDGQHGSKNLNQRQCHCVCNFQQESRRDGGQKEERYNLWIMMVIVIKLFKLGKEYHTGKLSTIRGKSPPIKCKLLTNRLFLLAPKACFAFGLDCLLFRSSILDDFES